MDGAFPPSGAPNQTISRAASTPTLVSNGDLGGDRRSIRDDSRPDRPIGARSHEVSYETFAITDWGRGKRSSHQLLDALGARQPTTAPASAGAVDELVVVRGYGQM
jgi:hypothetical protein